MTTNHYNHLTIYRVSAIFGSITFVAAGLMMRQPDAAEWLAPLRVALSLGLFSWAVLSFFSRWVRVWIGEGTLLLGMGLLVYFCLSLVESQLAARQMIAATIAIVAGALMYHKGSLVIAWCATSAAAYLGILVFVPEPTFSPVMFAGIVLVLSTMACAAMLFTVHSRARISRSAAITQAIFDRSADALTYGDLASRTIYGMNTNAERLFETSDPDEMIRLVQSSLLEHGHEDIGERVARGETFDETVRFETATGSTFYGAITMAGLGDDYDSLVVMRITDVSELHLKTEALRQARDVAESAMEVRTRFLANMSHEIRTPMNGVIGMTSLLLNTELNEEQLSYVDTIRSSGDSLLSIINEILDFSKIEAGQIQLEHQAFDVEACVADALDIVSPIAAAKELEVILDLPVEHTGTVIGDVQRIRQVLVNLLSNSVKFTEEGEVTLRVSQVVDDLEGENVRLTFEVSDTGIGIPGYKLDHLFEAFTQADASTTRRFGGTGLGLSISRSLVELMGGELRVSSVEGEGSTFGFYVRVARGASAQAPQSDFAGRRIAVIDDNQTNRRVLEGMLSHWHAESISYTDAEAFLAVRPDQFDLILTDMAMPGTDGLQMVNELKVRHRTLPPIILLTSLDRTDVDWSAFDSVMRKPIRPTDLHRLISQALEGRSNPQTERSQGEAPLSLQNQTVLLAEDNPVNQTVAKKMLQKLGVRVDTAGTGREAIEMLSQQNYSVIFMDVQMPEVDGLEATRLIRLLEDSFQPYIIAMTANALAEDREACIDSGMDDFVPKPIRLGDVREALSRAVDSGAFSNG